MTSVELWWRDQSLRRDCSSGDRRRRRWEDRAEDVEFLLEVLRQAPTFSALLRGRSWRIARIGDADLALSAGGITVLASLLSDEKRVIGVNSPGQPKHDLQNATKLCINAVATTTRGGTT